MTKSWDDFTGFDAYTWSLVIKGRTFTNKSIILMGKYCGGVADNKSTWREGCTPWQMGPPK